MSSSNSSLNSTSDIWEPMALSTHTHSSAFQDSVGSLDLGDLSDNDSVSDFDFDMDIAHAFDNSVIISSSKSQIDEVSDVSSSAMKRAKLERSCSPEPKRRQLGSAMEQAAESSRLAVSGLPVDVSSSLTLEDLQAQYQLSLQHLAFSMRRSELTRQEIARQQKLVETQRKIQEAEAQTFSKADSFLTGSRATLTVGLEQSRSMLRSYMNQLM